MRPPASTTAIVCAAASRRDQSRATWRSGIGIGEIGAEVGAGADHDRHLGVAQAAYGLGEVAHGRGRQHRVGDVVGADQDDGDVGVELERGVDLGVQVAGLCADHGELAQVHAPVRALGHTGAEPGARVSPRRWPRRSRRRWSHRAARS